MSILFLSSPLKYSYDMEKQQTNDLKFWLAISKCMEFKPRILYQLLSEFKSAKNLWLASEVSLKKHLNDKKIASFTLKKKIINPDSLEKILINLKITAITINNENYPKLLKEISDPPPIIYVKGNTDILNDLSIGIVGSRKATNIGKDITFFLAQKLSQKGITVISGLAEGIDSEAHLGAIAGYGKTIAVLGNSLDYIYPASNNYLAKKIIDNGGAIISEYFPYTKTEKYFFVARNRIISGLSKGVLITEATEKSGALITADFAIEQNRNVYSIPGDITKKQSVGTNYLLKQGAKVVTTPSDILEDFGLAEQGEVPIEIGDLEKIIIKSLVEPKTVDEISADLGSDNSQIIEAISMLELKGLIKNSGGQIFKL
jgi:DNA processing protein